MHATAFPVPTNQLFRGQPEGDHRELEIEPFRLEPKEEIDAEDDGKRSETEGVGVTPRPTEQQVECVREDELSEDEVCRGVNLRPVPPPIQEHRTLRARLKVVLLPQDHIECKHPPATPGPDEQDYVPHA